MYVYIRTYVCTHMCVRRGPAPTNFFTPLAQSPLFPSPPPPLLALARLALWLQEKPNGRIQSLFYWSALKGRKGRSVPCSLAYLIDPSSFSPPVFPLCMMEIKKEDKDMGEKRTRTSKLLAESDWLTHCHSIFVFPLLRSLSFFFSVELSSFPHLFFFQFHVEKRCVYVWSI